MQEAQLQPKPNNVVNIFKVIIVLLVIGVITLTAIYFVKSQNRKSGSEVTPTPQPTAVIKDYFGKI